MVDAKALREQLETIEPAGDRLAAKNESKEQSTALATERTPTLLDAVPSRDIVKEAPEPP